MMRFRMMMMRFMPGSLSCQEVDAFIVDYLDGRLPERQVKVFERHLRMCPECRAYLENYRNTLALERAAFAEHTRSSPDEMPEDLVKAIMAARDGEP